MGIRTDKEYRAMGIPSQSPFDWRVAPPALTKDQQYAKEYYARKLAEKGKTKADAQKALLTRQNKLVDLAAYGISKSERAGR